MKSLISFLKTMIFTFLIVIILQVRLGEEKLDEHFQSFMSTSKAGAYINEVATGAVGAIRDLYSQVIGQIDSKVTESFNSKRLPGKRKFLNVDRSDIYKAEEKLKENARDVQKNITDEDFVIYEETTSL